MMNPVGQSRVGTRGICQYREGNDDWQTFSKLPGSQCGGMTMDGWIYWEDLLAPEPWIPGGYIYPLTLLLQPHFLLARFQPTPPKLSHPSNHHDFLVRLYHAHLLAGPSAVRISGVRGSCPDQCNAEKGVAVHNLRLLEDCNVIRKRWIQTPCHSASPYPHTGIYHIGPKDLVTFDCKFVGRATHM